jgi:hypothetical protein
MGAFYGSIHVRTEGREAVLDAAKSLARKGDARFLVAPVLRGWVTLFPNNNGQDERMSKTLAGRLSDEILQVIVHDDDIFSYAFYRDGKLVDQYNSRPDYFGRVSKKKKEQSRGHPETLVHLLSKPETLDELKLLLSPQHADEITFASGSLQRFAELLDLPNAMSAYEYLMQGETDDIEGWDEFTHVPDRGPELAQKQAEEDSRTAEKQRLREQGVLFYEESRPAPAMQAVQPVVCAAGDSGLFVCWVNGMEKRPCPLLHYRTPWHEPAVVGVDLPPSAQVMRVSPSGRYLGVGHAFGNWKAQVFDLQAKTPLFEVPHQNMAGWLGFSADEKEFFSLDPMKGVRTSMATHKALSSFAVEYGKLGVLHPTGALLIASETGRLSFVDPSTGAIQRALVIAKKAEAEAMQKYMAAQLKQSYANFDPETFEKMLQTQMAQMEKVIKQLHENAAKTGGKEGAEQAARMREVMQQQLERSREDFARKKREVETGKITLPGSERIMSMEGSPDGKWVILGTSAGIRVYAWDDLAVAEEYMPEPAFKWDGTAVVVRQGMSMPGNSYIYALTYDEPGRRVVFGGLGGTIQSLDLSTGKTSTLMDIPGRPAILRLALTRDGSALACVVHPEMLAEGNNRKPPVLQIWNYAALQPPRLRVV